MILNPDLVPGSLLSVLRVFISHNPQGKYLDYTPLTDDKIEEESSQGLTQGHVAMNGWNQIQSQVEITDRVRRVDAWREAADGPGLEQGCIRSQDDCEQVPRASAAPEPEGPGGPTSPQRAGLALRVGGDRSRQPHLTCPPYHHYPRS